MNDAHPNFMKDWVESHPNDYEIINEPDITRVRDRKPPVKKERVTPQVVRKGKQRMSGDNLESYANDIIGELRDEAAYEEIVGLKDMVHSLRQRDADVSARWDSALSEAGLSRENLNAATNIENNDIQLVGNISPRTPQAIEFNWAKDTVTSTGRDRRTRTSPVTTQSRLHSQFEVNPLTGQVDVVPFMDSETSKPLVTQFGRVGQSVNPSDVEYMDTDEFLGKRIMQLTGQPVVRNNDADKYAVDLINEGNGKKVDVELAKTEDLQRNPNIGFQVYTEMAPQSIAGTRPLRGTPRQSAEIADDMSEELRVLLRGKMEQGASLNQAVAELERERMISNSDGRDLPYWGKLLKDGGTYVDDIVYPVVSRRNAGLNKATESQDGQRTLVMPLDGAYLGDANAARAALNSSGPELVDNVSVHPMTGNRGRFRPSGKVYLDVPLTDSAVQDLSKQDLVRQLFKQQKRTSR